METEVNVRLSALSNHQHGGLGSWTYEVGERTRKWSRTDHWKFKWREWEHKERSRHEYDCMCMSKCVGQDQLWRGSVLGIGQLGASLAPMLISTSPIAPSHNSGCTYSLNSLPKEITVARQVLDTTYLLYW